MPVMQILRHGVDLVEVDRIAEMLDRHGERFATRVFTEAEQRYADAGRRRRPERYAVRFACKEAVLKALGTGWRDGIAWRDVGVVRLPSGAPELRLSGEVARLAEGQGLTRWAVSLSHTARYAVASVVATGDAPEDTAA